MGLGDGLTFGPQIPDPLGNLIHGRDFFPSPLDDFINQSKLLYPLSNGHRRNQQKLMEQDEYLRQNHRQELLGNYLYSRQSDGENNDIDCDYIDCDYTDNPYYWKELWEALCRYDP